MSRRWTVRRMLATLLAVNLAAFTLVGVVGVAVASLSASSVNYLTQQLEPAVRDNGQMLQHLTDAETEIRGWSLSGDRSLLVEYHRSVAELPSTQRRLEKFAVRDPELGRLVARQAASAEAWFAGYARPRLKNATGVIGFDRGLFDNGLHLFRQLRTDNAAVTERLTELADRARHTADIRLRRTLIAIGVMAIVALATSLEAGRRVYRRVALPLTGLEATVNRLAGGEFGARAEVDGPREIARVGLAVNEMAAEVAQARAVETEVAAQMRSLDSATADFVSNVSHELRTPLTSIGGYVEILEGEFEGRLAPGEAGMIDAVKRNVVRLRDLIEDLLALSRAESRDTNLEQIDLVVMLRDVVSDQRMPATHRGIQIDLATPEPPVVVLADLSQLTRAVSNLLSNAVKFSEGPATVTVTAEVAHGEVTIEVRDHGIGIPADEMDRIGSRFYRASNAVSLNVPGTGLGLRIVQAILERHRASLDLAETIGGGITARITMLMQSNQGIHEQT